MPPPRSGFKDIEKLPPGNVALAEDGALTYRRWWPRGADAQGARPSGPESGEFKLDSNDLN